MVFQVFSRREFRRLTKFVIFREFLENTDFLQIFLKIWGFWYTRNFSLSAKFNRFFIILGGLEEKDQKSWFFKKDRKSTILKKKPRFFKYSRNMRFSSNFQIRWNMWKIVVFWDWCRGLGRVRYLKYLGSIYVFFQ